MNAVVSRQLGPRLVAPLLRSARFATHVCHAKKKGKKGKKKQKPQKKGLFDGLPERQVPKPWDNTEMIMQHFLCIESYRYGVHVPLLLALVTMKGGWCSGFV